MAIFSTAEFRGIRSLFCIAACTLLTAPRSGADSPALEEIVVTARRIEEPVQAVPMSVQVLSGDALDDANLSHVFDLQFNVPGLVVNNAGMFGARFALRGITDEGGTSLSIASHLNGVYLGNASLAIGRLFDIERIEVLKGPQGTLYGRNATGGSINVISRTPQQAFGAAIEASLGSFDTTRLQGHLNLPFGKSAVRLAIAGAEGDGFIRNTADDRKFAEADFWGLRGAWQYDATDSLRFWLMAQHVEDDGASGELWLPNPTFAPDPSDIHLTTVTISDPFLITRNDYVSLNVEYDAGVALLRSVSGYARNETNNRDDCAGFPFLRGCVRDAFPDAYRQLSEEIQIASAGDARVNWLLGANYFTGDRSTRFSIITPLLDPLPTNNALWTSTESAYAVFGQATLNVGERWKITGGLRSSYEKQRVSSIGTGTADSPTLTVAENNWQRVSWRFDLEYALSETRRAYAAVSTGFKSGGVTTERLPNGEFDSFDTEDLTAYELGLKSQWRDRRLLFNVAAFLYDFVNMQVASVYFDGPRTVTDVDNAAAAEIYGIDAHGVFRMSDRWIVSSGVVWMPKREFTDFRNNTMGLNLSGNKISLAPEWTSATSASYEVPVAGHGNFSATLEYNYRSGYFFTKENLANNAQEHFGLLNLQLRFESPSDRWYIFASGRNLTDEDYFTQVFIQASPGYPPTYELGFGLRFPL